MSDRTHRSIGEVLHLLEDEFPEVTISKIRFLESQGLLNPERTPSGYRMFFNEDIGRLKWILVQQRDNFLPLRVIKKRLDSNEWSPEEFAISDVPAQADTFARNVEATEAGAASAVGEASPASVDDVASRLQAAAPAVADAVPEPVDVVPVAAVAAAEANPAPQIVQSTPVAPVEPPPVSETAQPPVHVAEVVPLTPVEEPSAATAPPEPITEPALAAAPIEPPVAEAPVDVVEVAPAARQPVAEPPVAAPAPIEVVEAPAPIPQAVPQAPAAVAPPPESARPVQHASTMLPLHPPRNDALEAAPVLASAEAPRTGALDSSATDVTFNSTELAEAAGIDIAMVRELQKFGIIEAVAEDPPTFDADSLMIARAAAAFMAHGLEPRHLKPFRIAAEREAGMLEQLTLPVARQKSAGASRRAVDLANELVSMGSDLRYAMLRRSLRSTLELD